MSRIPSGTTVELSTPLLFLFRDGAVFSAALLLEPDVDVVSEVFGVMRLWYAKGVAESLYDSTYHSRQDASHLAVFAK